MPALLVTKNLHKTFGAVTAANDVNVAIDEGEVVGVIGANGAGKTTFVNMVTGYLKPSAGSIHFRDRDITRLSPKEVTAAGISRSFQIPQLFNSATVFENLLIAIGIAEAGSLPLWRPIAEARRAARCDETLERYAIAAYRDQTVETLPQGIRKLLDIAMATVHSPQLVLLDEPTSGVSVEEKFGLMDIIMGALAADKVTVLFIEHDMEIVERYVHRVLAFYQGEIICDAPPDVALRDPKVKAYVIGEELHRVTHGAGRLADA